MKAQDKTAEISLVEAEIAKGSWKDCHLNLQDRRKQLQLLDAVLSQNQLILDAGCGPGTYGIILAEQNNVIGVDISYQAALVAKEIAKSQNARFWPIVGDLEMLPFGDNSFDICFCAYTLHHFPDICNALGELIRTLKPGGKIVLLEPNGANPGVKLSNFIESLISKWLFRYGLDTPNETIHRYERYVHALKQQELIDIQMTTCYFGGLPPIPSKSQGLDVSLFVIHFVVHVRRLIYLFLGNVLPQPLKGTSVLITGTKKALITV